MPGATLFCILLIVYVCVNDVIAGDTELVYNGFAGSNLELDGAAYITDEGIFSLTTCSSDINQGHGFHPMNIPLVSSFNENIGMHGFPSFSSTFVFAITPSYSSHSGEGMAFVISSTPYMNDGRSGAYMGLNDYRVYPGTTFLAIELDTVADPEFRDIDSNHVGIDLNNLESIYSRSAGYDYNEYVGNKKMPKSVSLRLSSGDPMQVWVDYNNVSRQLDVTLSPVPNLIPRRNL